jgi:hypothetical protein
VQHVGCARLDAEDIGDLENKEGSGYYQEEDRDEELGVLGRKEQGVLEEGEA